MQRTVPPTSSLALLAQLYALRIATPMEVGIRVARLNDPCDFLAFVLFILRPSIKDRVQLFLAEVIPGIVHHTKIVGKFGENVRTNVGF